MKRLNYKIIYTFNWLNSVNVLRVSFDEKIFIDLLFNKNSFPQDNFNLLNYENLIKISSRHLLLPTLYFKLKEKKCLKYVPKNFKEYLRGIYEINNNRNIIFESEVNEIEKIFYKNNLDFIFLKGAYYLKNGIYNNSGERMIGDIDFLVSKKDLNKVGTILRKENYSNTHEYMFWKARHLRRFINEKKMFALEPHSEILLNRKKKLIRGRDVLFLGSKIDKINLVKICILNFQINDYGHLYAKKSYRAMYDFIKILGDKKLNHKDFNNKYYRRFFLISNLYGITNYNVNKVFLDILYMKRFELKTRYVGFRLVDNFICKCIEHFFKLPMRIIEFLASNKYRKHVIKKLNT